MSQTLHEDLEWQSSSLRKAAEREMLKYNVDSLFQLNQNELKQLSTCKIAVGVSGLAANPHRWRSIVPEWRENQNHNVRRNGRRRIGALLHLARLEVSLSTMAVRPQGHSCAIIWRNKNQHRIDLKTSNQMTSIRKTLSQCHIWNWMNLKEIPANWSPHCVF